MNLIKEYVDRAVQTELDTVRSPYSDPAVVLAALPVTRRGLGQEVHAGCHNSVSASSPTGSDIAYVSSSTTSPMVAPLGSRRPFKHKHTRYPAGEIVNRRIVSMPENRIEILRQGHSKRIVSMPDRVRPVLEPSAELFHSPTAVCDSSGSFSGLHEHVRTFRAPSDVPQTPSPPSSPESLLIIAAGTQLPEGFLRRKCSPEPLIEEDEDWAAWANSPPRPIPALHGPLSLPYARCPSGAEGTIIEEPDNLAQMIWGLGPDDQPHNQVCTESHSSHLDNLQDAHQHGPNQVPPRLQRKRTSATQQVSKLPRTQGSSYPSDAKQNITRHQRQVLDDKRSPLSQVLPDIETAQDIVSGLPWNERRLTPSSAGVPEDFVDDTGMLSVDNNDILEWQLARLQQAFRTSLVDMDSYTTYPGRLEPVIPTAVAPGFSYSYPRIFVESRPNESVSSARRQSPVEIAQQHRQQQLYRQALQKQKLQIQNILPTPPNSSSPQWSSHFSPYLTYCSTFSPELAGSSGSPAPVASQKHRQGVNASQNPRRDHDRHGHDNNFDSNTNGPSANTSHVVPNINSAPFLRQSSSSSSTLAKYIKQLQALSPIAQFSPLQPVLQPNASGAPLGSNDKSIATLRSVYHSPINPTPPSPESPQPRGSSHYVARSMAPTGPVQRRLSSVPEEDSGLLELSTISPPRLQGHITTDSISSSHDETTGHQIRHLDITRKSAISDLPEFESDLRGPSIAFYRESSPVKVRLPVTREHDTREQTGRHHEQHKGHRKRHRYKKLRTPAAPNEQATMRGLVG